MAQIQRIVGEWRLSDGIWDDLALDHPVAVREALRVDGCIPEIETGLDMLRDEWVENHRWTYSARFCAPDAVKERAYLTLEGVFGACEVLINGVKVMRAHARTFSIEITGELRAGENTLSLAFEPGARGLIGGASLVIGALPDADASDPAPIAPRGFYDCEKSDFHFVAELNANAVCPEYASQTVALLARGEGLVCLSDSGKMASPASAMQRVRNCQALSGGERWWPAPSMVWRLTKSDLSSCGDLFSINAEDASNLSRYRQAEALSAAAHQARLRGEAFMLRNPREGQFAYASRALLDMDDAPRPAAGALRGAWRAQHAFILAAGVDMNERVVRLPIYYVNDGNDNRVRLIAAAAYAMDGSVFAARSFPVLRMSASPVGYLTVTKPEEGTPWLARVCLRYEDETIDQSDCVIDAELAIDAEQTCLTVTRGSDGVTVQNTGAVTALGVSFGGAASGAFPGWGALLPGEKLWFSRLLTERAEGLNIYIN